MKMRIWSGLLLLGAATLSSPTLAQQDIDTKTMLDHAQIQAGKLTGGKLMDKVGGRASGGSEADKAELPADPNGQKTRSLQQLLRDTPAPTRDLDLPRH